ncbi:hypothetical protein CI102_3008 [Trichoderma harzianum]|uniref:Uncharacterized protein n=1 Tax=Trichoderma harzianum CBS 226.95 TaxID=983964 RepID=A0A2T4A243_TRIHA|nr:hypothetical protein M431DRAFT_235519 [Trichoderma harzianum CBS 226.95]PKK53228.1 hypothetical protein CI102_3008 [Trichoderma harzianum]PTB51135.1 hypothetical protein M431DRAFT_235519 [Trichoderma harzianum CBS 226.95]
MPSLGSTDQALGMDVRGWHSLGTSLEKHMIAPRSDNGGRISESPIYLVSGTAALAYSPSSETHRDRESVNIPASSRVPLLVCADLLNWAIFPVQPRSYPKKGRVSAAPVRPPCVHIVISPVCKRMHDMICFTLLIIPHIKRTSVNFAMDGTNIEPADTLSLTPGPLRELVL